MSAPAAPAPLAGLMRRWGATPAQLVLMLAITAFLVAFLVVPVVRVLVAAFGGASGFTLVHFGDFFRASLLRESFANSFYVATMSVVLASLLAVPPAYFLARFDFRGAALIQALGVLPLVMPPFVGAVAMQLIFGRNGSVNLLLQDWFGIRVPFMEGLNGVVFVEALHYFPFILLNLSAALANIDSAMEESAQVLGARGWTLFRRIVLPLAMPGYVAGASLVFVKVFDDLGTPLMLNQTNLLAPQGYLRITSIGLDDPMGYVIATILVACSLAAMGVAALALRGRDFATQQRGGGGLGRRSLTGWRRVMVWMFVGFVIVLVLSPHLGLLLLSLATVWSFSVVPDALTLAHYGKVFTEAAPLMWNTLLYCGLAASIDVVLGVSIAYLALRTRIPGRRLLDYVVMASLAVPGLVLGIGILRTYFDVKLPLSGEPLATFWGMLVIGYAIRRLPYALRACDAVLRQLHVTLEEAAEALGAARLTILRRIVVPLMVGGILAGFVTSFATAAVELSETLLLVARDADAPISYGIYVYMQSAAGRGPGAALGVIAVLVVALGAWLSHRFAERDRTRRSRGGIV